jgi:hypothetical protein
MAIHIRDSALLVKVGKTINNGKNSHQILKLAENVGTDEI